MGFGVLAALGVWWSCRSGGVAGLGGSVLGGPVVDPGVGRFGGFGGFGLFRKTQR